MKVVIIGDKKTGKSSLFNLMQKKNFKEAYIPTEEISATHINWDYKVTGDNVQVVVWDVVEKCLSHSFHLFFSVHIFLV